MLLIDNSWNLDRNIYPEGGMIVYKISDYLRSIADPINVSISGSLEQRTYELTGEQEALLNMRHPDYKSWVKIINEG